MSTAIIKFNSPEEQSAFGKLLALIPRRQGWNDTKHTNIAVCPICNGNTLVKSGIVPFDSFFEPERFEGYTFWNCCQSCHDQGWHIPEIVFRESMKYWRINPEKNHQYEERVVTNFKLFKFPSIMFVNLDTVLVSI